MEENKDLLPDEQDEKTPEPEVITFTGGITLRAPGAGI